MTTLLGLGVVWTGYLLVWYGATTFIGPGIGLLDLANPGKAGEVARKIQGRGGPGVNASGGAPGFIGPPIPGGGSAQPLFPRQPDIGNNPVFS